MTEDPSNRSLPPEAAQKAETEGAETGAGNHKKKRGGAGALARLLRSLRRDRKSDELRDTLEDFFVRQVTSPEVQSRDRGLGTESAREGR